MCTVNVGTMIARGREVTEMLYRRGAAVCCVHEVQYRGAGCRIVGDSDERYKFWWSGEKNTERKGVVAGTQKKVTTTYPPALSTSLSM